MRPILNPWPRVIMHADMDAFFAAVETLDEPRLGSVPLIIGGRSQRSVVCTANYIARRFGIRSAMPIRRALRLCPEAVVVPPRHKRYREVSKDIMDVFRGFTPLVEPLSLDEAYLDLSEVAEDYDGPRVLGLILKKAVTERTGGLKVSVGISTSKFVAKVASDFQKPDGLTVVDETQVHDFIRPLPTSRLWGAGPKTVARLKALGMETIGDVADAPVGQLKSLGRQGSFLNSLAHGQDQREVVPHREVKSVGWERTVEVDLQSKTEIRALLQTAAVEVERRLQARGLGAKGVRIKLKTRRFELITRQRSLRHSTQEGAALLGNAIALLTDLDIGEPIRLVGLTAYDLNGDDEAVQLTLFPGLPTEPVVQEDV